MLQFNDLRISEDGRYLIIDVQVKEGNYFENIFIDSIYINTQDEFNGHSPTESKISTFNNINVGERSKYFREYIDLDGMGVNNSLLFVWVVAKGTVAEDAPCCFKNDNTILGAAYNKLELYNLGMKYFNNLQDCTISGELLDYIIRSKAFEINLKAGNYIDAIKYWKLLLGPSNNVKLNKCGCHAVI